MEETEAVACAVQNLARDPRLRARRFPEQWRRHVHRSGQGFFGLGLANKLLGFFNLSYVRTPDSTDKRGLVQNKTCWVAA